MTLSFSRFTRLLNDRGSYYAPTQPVWRRSSAPRQRRGRQSSLGYSLVAPVESHGDVPLDLASLVLGEVTLDELPTQVDELVHHVAELMEQVHLVFLLTQGETQAAGFTIGCVSKLTVSVIGD